MKLVDISESGPGHTPSRKISKTFLEFATPCLDVLPTTATAEDVKKVLEVAFVVWNAVVFEEAKGNPSYLHDIRSRMSQEPELAAIVDALIDRKREFYENDQRLIGDYRVCLRDDSLSLWAEARSPFKAE